MKAIKAIAAKLPLDLTDAQLLKMADQLEQQSRELAELAFQKRQLVIHRGNAALYKSIVDKDSKNSPITRQEAELVETVHRLKLKTQFPAPLWNRIRACVRTARRAGRIVVDK